MPKKSVKKGDPLIGAIVDRRWEVREQLGSGGMGVVYHAERVKLGKQVALKFLHQSVLESKSAVARFEREAKAISRLHHINCVSILDFGVYRKQPYIVMEFVHGRRLSELSPESVTPTRAVAFMRQVLLGLGHAHSRGVIHRDLKLSNVMLVEMTGTEDQIKILDFGLARISGLPGGEEELSLTGDMIAGTPSYMSPEQAQGKKTDQRSDIYSAGVMLYVLCTGKRPFVGAGTTELLQRQINDAPQSPRRVAPGKKISEALERVILRAMEKKPAARFQNADEFVAALDDTPEGQETLTPTVAREKRPGRRWRLMGIAAAACIALGAAGALSLRAYFIGVRARAVGAYQRWSQPAKPIKEPAARPKPLPPSPHAATPPHAAPTPPPRPATPAPTVTSAPKTPAVTPPPIAATTPSTVPAAKPTGVAELPDPPAPAPQEPAPSPPVETPPAEEHAAKAAPEPSAPEPSAPPVHHAVVAPSREVREWRDHIDGLIADGNVNAAKNQLRDRIAVDKSDGWAHLRLGDVYAEPFHFRRDAAREWDSALGLEPGLEADAAFRKSLCAALDGSDHAAVEQLLRDRFGAEKTPPLLAACIRGTSDPQRIENAAQVIEAVAGPARPELGMAALRILDVGKSCTQKKAAVETIRRLHYVRARGALVKLDRQRQAHHGRPPAALACFGTTIADALEQLK